MPSLLYKLFYDSYSYNFDIPSNNIDISSNKTDFIYNKGIDIKYYIDVITTYLDQYIINNKKVNNKKVTDKIETIYDIITKLINIERQNNSIPPFNFEINLNNPEFKSEPQTKTKPEPKIENKSELETIIEFDPGDKTKDISNRSLNSNFIFPINVELDTKFKNEIIPELEQYNNLFYTIFNTPSDLYIKLITSKNFLKKDFSKRIINNKSVKEYSLFTDRNTNNIFTSVPHYQRSFYNTNNISKSFPSPQENNIVLSPNKTFSPHLAENDNILSSSSSNEINNVNLENPNSVNSRDINVNISNELKFLKETMNSKNESEKNENTKIFFNTIKRYKQTIKSVQNTSSKRIQMLLQVIEDTTKEFESIYRKINPRATANEINAAKRSFISRQIDLPVKITTANEKLIDSIIRACKRIINEYKNNQEILAELRRKEIDNELNNGGYKPGSNEGEGKTVHPGGEVDEKDQNEKPM